MKICKNCGRQTDDEKVRCPYCGYLFEEDMDSVLRKMKENLNAYRDSVAAAPAQAPAAPAAQNPAQAAVPAQQNSAQTAAPAAQNSAQAAVPAQQNSAQAAPAADGNRERFELLTEVAQLKGELRALHTEIDRMNGTQYGQPRQYVSQAAGQPQYVQQPVQLAQPVVYAPYPAAQAAYTQQPNARAADGKQRVARSSNRIVLSVISILLLALSVGMFFVAWVGTEADAFLFKGFDGIAYLFNKEGENVAGFAAYLAQIEAHQFAGGDMIANVCRAACRYVVEYGVIVYAAFLVLGIPLLFSLSGRVSLKGWHRFVSWMSFIVALLLFGVFCWVTGFSSVSILFMVGAGANLVRCLFLAFYKGKKKKLGGLE